MARGKRVASGAQLVVTRGPDTGEVCRWTGETDRKGTTLHVVFEDGVRAWVRRAMLKPTH